MSAPSSPPPRFRLPASAVRARFRLPASAGRLALALTLPVIGACQRVRSPIEPPPTTKPAPSLAPDPAPPPRVDGRLPGGVVPTSYRLDLTIDPREDAFLGHARIAVVIERPTRAIVLHGRGLRVQLASLEQGGQKLWTRPRSRLSAGAREPEELVLPFDRELAAGPAQIDFEYAADFGKNLGGLYRVEEAGGAYAFSKFEPTDARRAFPCFDEPGYKVPFELAVSVPAGLDAFSNMPLAKRTEQLESGLVTYEFQRSPPLPTYLVALAVGAFEVREASGSKVPLRLIAVRGRAELGKLALETAPAQLEFLARYFGQPFPYPKLDLLAVPNFASGAMENAGLITFREELLLLDERRASTSARRAMAGVMAHELSHQWFGDLVTMAWWDDLWLNEAFATWMAPKVVDALMPELGAGRELLGRRLAVMSNDALSTARKIRQPVRSTSDALEAFDPITYVKGASVLGMVEHWLGEPVFQSGVGAYLARHAWKNATSQDLFAALEAASQKSVAPVFNAFVEQTGVPLISARPSCERGASVTLQQSEYRLLGSPPGNGKSWRLPVCVASSRGKARSTDCTLLERESGELALGPVCPRWTFANADAAGYYRMALASSELGAQSKLAAKNLSEVERAALVGDAWALVQSGGLGVEVYLESLRHFRSEPSAVVWEQIAASLFRIERTLVSDPERAAFGRRIVELVGPKARELGWQVPPGESAERRMLRRTCLTLLGQLSDDPWAAAGARAQAERWLDPAQDVDADVAAAALPIRGKRADQAWFDALRAALTSAATPERRLQALSGLTSLEDAARIEQVLNFTLDGTLKLQDTRYVFGPLFERRAARGIAHAWLVAHFDELARKLPGALLGRALAALGQLCDEKQVAAAEAFFRPKLSAVEGAEKHLNQALENGRQCVALAAYQGPRLLRWLEPRKGEKTVRD